MLSQTSFLPQIRRTSCRGNFYNVSSRHLLRRRPPNSSSSSTSEQALGKGDGVADDGKTLRKGCCALTKLQDCFVLTVYVSLHYVMITSSVGRACFSQYLFIVIVNWSELKTCDYKQIKCVCCFYQFISPTYFSASSSIL